MEAETTLIDAKKMAKITNIPSVRSGGDAGKDPYRIIGTVVS